MSPTLSERKRQSEGELCGNCWLIRERFMVLSAMANDEMYVEALKEAIWRLKIHDNRERGGVAQSSPYPDRP
ncbi:hypothetical protein ACOSQ4_008748 [Xanthoceras sorbifolium]